MEYDRPPSGERPDAHTELKAFAFGAGVSYGDDHVYTAVRVQQGIQIGPVTAIVVSELSAADAREFAASLIERAEIVEGTRTDVSS